MPGRPARSPLADPPLPKEPRPARGDPSKDGGGLLPGHTLLLPPSWKNPVLGLLRRARLEFFYKDFQRKLQGWRLERNWGVAWSSVFSTASPADLVELTQPFLSPIPQCQKAPGPSGRPGVGECRWNCRELSSASVTSISHPWFSDVSNGCVVIKSQANLKLRPPHPTPPPTRLLLLSSSIRNPGSPAPSCVS